jgi:hypothetical protein
LVLKKQHNLSCALFKHAVFSASPCRALLPFDASAKQCGASANGPRNFLVVRRRLPRTVSEMAEVFKTTDAGEITQQFMQFILMHQQQALLALGKHPNPPPGAPGPNLVLAKIFIDQLSAIREKTRGNLSNDEASVLNNVLSSLQMQYAETAPKS